MRYMHVNYIQIDRADIVQCNKKLRKTKIFSEKLLFPFFLTVYIVDSKKSAVKFIHFRKGVWYDKHYNAGV